MNNSSSHTHSVDLAGVAIFIALLGGGCVQTSYSRENDERAFQQIESEWSSESQTELMVRLCEDPGEAAAKDPTGTINVEYGADMIDHVAKGDGRASYGDTSCGPGCGGLEPMVIAYVEGKMKGAELSGTIPLFGYIRIGSSCGEGDAYDLPYKVKLWCMNNAQPRCALEGTIKEGGILSLTFEALGDVEMTLPQDGDLLRSGPAVCP